MNRRMLVVGGIALLCLVVVAVLVVRFWPRSRAEQVAAEARAQFVLPAQIDAITRLDSIEASGETIVYLYTLSRSDPDMLDKLRDGLGRVVCAKPELRELLAQGVGLEYRYRTADSTALPPIAFTAASCTAR